MAAAAARGKAAGAMLFFSMGEAAAKEAERAGAGTAAPTAAAAPAYRNLGARSASILWEGGGTKKLDSASADLCAERGSQGVRARRGREGKANWESAAQRSPPRALRSGERPAHVL